MSDANLYHIRSYTPADGPAVVALQTAYAERYPGAAVIPAAVYGMPGFGDGANIFCAVDRNSDIVAYAPLMPELVTAHAPDLPHTLWAEIKAHPQLAQPGPVKDLLLDAVLARARTIVATVATRPACLLFQYLPSEQESIAYVCSKGAVHEKIVYRMRRDLTAPFPHVPKPEGIVAERWRMETEAEQVTYVAARNQAFPESPTTLADWQYWMQAPLWTDGTLLAAFDDGRLAGSVQVYWDPEQIRQTGVAAGYTETIFVLPPYRRRGIASYLIGEGLAYLREHGLAEARLEVAVANAHALGLYCALGYDVMHETHLFALPLT